MGIFKKSGSVDVLDIPSLQKKGILKRAGFEKYEAEMNKSDMPSGIKVTSGFVDLTSFSDPSVPSSGFATENNSPLSSLSTPGMDSPFGMLDSLAQSASSNNGSYFNNDSNPLSSLSTSSPFSSSSSSSSEVNALKLKIDDLEYKLGTLLEKLARIEEHLRG